MLVGAVAALFCCTISGLLAFKCQTASSGLVHRSRLRLLPGPHGRGSLPPQRAIVNFAADDAAGLVCIIKHKMKKFQDQARLIDGCLTGTGLKIESW